MARQANSDQSLKTFESFYAAQFGPRWSELRSALQAPGPQVNLRECGAFDGDYWLDPASLFLSRLLAQALRGMANPSVWDMCAAPGGKMLGLLPVLGQSDFQVLASEISRPRFARLQQQRLLLPTPLQQRCTLQCGDACRIALRHKAAGRNFDAILLDAPCSSERHVLQKPDLLEQWSASRSKRNAQTQISLLCAALDCLAPNGLLLYATCALSAQENGEAVRRALHKRPHLAVTAQPVTTGQWTLEAQEPGYSILPDRNSGAGPLYFCLLQRGAD